MFIGTLVTFLIQHLLGLDGMPRRVYEYDNVGHLQLYNQISTIGSFILGAGVLVTVINVMRWLKLGAVAGPDPWQANTLEWFIALAAAGPQLRRDPARALARTDEGHPPRDRAADRWSDGAGRGDGAGGRYAGRGLAG